MSASRSDGFTVKLSIEYLDIIIQSDIIDHLNVFKKTFKKYSLLKYPKTDCTDTWPKKPLSSIRPIMPVRGKRLGRTAHSGRTENVDHNAVIKLLTSAGQLSVC